MDSRILGVALVVATSLCSSGAWAQEADAVDPGVEGDGVGALLVVLNKAQDEAALVDPETYEVLDRLPTGAGPHEAAVSPDGRLAFVADYGGSTPGTTITVLDLEERRVLDTHDLLNYSRPHGIAASADGSVVWVTAEGARAVLELDAASGEIRRVWRTGQNVSHMVAPTPDESKLYVANIGSGSVSVIDRASGSVTTVGTGAGAEGIDVSPDGREVWVTNREEGTIAVIDVESDDVVAVFSSGGEIPIRVKFTPDGREAWVSNAGSDAVTVFRAADRSLAATLEVGAVPVGILIDPSGSRAFVANTRANRVTVFDVVTRERIDTFTTGTEPDGMAWRPARSAPTPSHRTGEIP